MSSPADELISYLRAALAASEAQNAELRAELKQVRAQLADLLEIAATQNTHLSDLRTMLRRKIEARKGANPTPPVDPEDDPDKPGGGGATGSGPETTPPDTPPPAPPADPPAKRPRKPRTKGTGRLAPPANLPVVGYTGTVCRCEHCGSDRLLARDHETSVRIDAAETIARLRQEVLEVVRCKDCGRTTTAERPSLPCPRAKFTCGFLAWLVTMKFVMLVPLNRIHKLLKRQGLVVPRSTLVRLIELASDLASTVDGAHWKQLKARSCVLTDATGLKVLVEGAPEAWDAIVDVFNGDHVAVYQFALTKHGDELAALLKSFQGVVMCDAESRLNELCRQEGIRRANCNAHPRRAFRDAEAQQPVLAREAGAFLSQMYAIERRAAAEGLFGAALLARRQLHTRPIVEKFKAWLLAHQDLLPSDPLGKVIRYYLRHFDDLTRFVDNPDVPIDNNPSERAFQDHARLRLNALFAGSAEGGRRWAILLGVVTTASASASTSRPTSPGCSSVAVPENAPSASPPRSSPRPRTSRCSSRNEAAPRRERVDMRETYAAGGRARLRGWLIGHRWRRPCFDRGGLDNRLSGLRRLRLTQSRQPPPTRGPHPPRPAGGCRRLDEAGPGDAPMEILRWRHPHAARPLAMSAVVKCVPRNPEVPLRASLCVRASAPGRGP